MNEDEAQREERRLLLDDVHKAEDEVVRLKAENLTLQRWINDLQSGMYINCVYCGHQYGPNPGTPISMADVLKKHIEQCPKHPMSALKAIVEDLKLDYSILSADYKQLILDNEGLKEHLPDNCAAGICGEEEEITAGDVVAMSLNEITKKYPKFCSDDAYYDLAIILGHYVDQGLLGATHTRQKQIDKLRKVLEPFVKHIRLHNEVHISPKRNVPCPTGPTGPTYADYDKADKAFKSIPKKGK